MYRLVNTYAKQLCVLIGGQGGLVLAVCLMNDRTYRGKWDVSSISGLALRRDIVKEILCLRTYGAIMTSILAVCYSLAEYNKLIQLTSDSFGEKWIGTSSFYRMLDGLSHEFGSPDLCFY